MRLGAGCCVWMCERDKGLQRESKRDGEHLKKFCVFGAKEAQLCVILLINTLNSLASLGHSKPEKQI